MKQYIKSLKQIFLGVAVLSAMGCSDFLQEKDKSNITPDNFFTIPEHAEAAVVATYSNLRFLNNGAGIFSANWQMLEMPTGTATTESGQNQDINNLLTLDHNGENAHINNWWNSLYRGIGNANMAIAKIPLITPMDEELRAKNLAEVKFLRALHYFYAVRLWGDVPLIITPVEKLDDPNVYAKRTPQAQVYDQIVKDLTEAEAANLPWANTDGRVSKGAIKSLLSSVYLTMAGFPLQKGAEYYQKAADKAKEVITNGGYSLFPKYNDLHNISLENKVEHIFMVQFTEGIATSGFQQLILPNFKSISAFDDEIGTTVPTASFISSYEPGDKRTAEKAFFYKSYYENGNGAPKELGKSYIYKHFDSLANGYPGFKGTTNSGLNWPLIRFAEVLLTYAEAQNEVAGPTEEVIAALKQVRDRAGLITPTVGETNQASLRELIWRERWHELCYEGKTWFDMVRLRKAFNESTRGFNEFVGHQFSDGVTTLESKHLLFPLPIYELKDNPNLGPQNPGY